MDESISELQSALMSLSKRIRNLESSPMGSIFQTFPIRILAPSVDVDTSSGVYYWRVPSTFDGMRLYRAQGYVDTAGTTNPTTIQVRNLTKYPSNDALSSAISIASGSLVGTVGVINTSYDGVSTDNLMKIYVVSNSTTKAKGLFVNLEYRRF